MTAERISKQIQIASDYRLSVMATSGVSESTWDTFVRCIEPLYENGSTPYSDGPRKLASAILEDIAIGSRVGLITHNPPDFLNLAQELRKLSRPLRLSAVACPHWIPGNVNGRVTFNPKLRRLGSGLFDSTNTLLSYTRLLSDRAERYGTDIHLSVSIAAWEVTRQDNLPTDERLSSQEALERVQSSRAELDAQLAQISHPNFTHSTCLLTSPEFHAKARDLQTQLLEESAKQVQYVYEARKDFYPDGEKQAALDLAESHLAFTDAKKRGDIIIVTTSPTIARACLSGNSPWIQLKPPYVG